MGWIPVHGSLPGKGKERGREKRNERGEGKRGVAEEQKRGTEKNNGKEESWKKRIASTCLFI